MARKPVTISTFGKHLKVGDKFELPHQFGTVKRVDKIGKKYYSLSNDVLLLTIAAEGGPFAGSTSQVVVTNDSSIKVMVKPPAIRRGFDVVWSWFKKFFG